MNRPLAAALLSCVLLGCDDGRPPSRQTQSGNNLHNLGIAASNYASANGGELPRGTIRDDEGRAVHGWVVQLLDGLDASAVRRRVDLQVAWDDPRNEEPMKTELSVLLYPGTTPTDVRGYALTSYATNARVIGGRDPLTIDAIAAGDGVSTTMLLGEVAGSRMPWGHPLNHRDPTTGFGPAANQFGSPAGTDTVNVLTADGAARVLGTDIDPRVLRALATPSGGEDIAPEDF